jgi:hypothetical protein
MIWRAAPAVPTSTKTRPTIGCVHERLVFWIVTGCSLPLTFNGSLVVMLVCHSSIRFGLRLLGTRCDKPEFVRVIGCALWLVVCDLFRSRLAKISQCVLLASTSVLTPRRRLETAWVVRQTRTSPLSATARPHVWPSPCVLPGKRSALTRSLRHAPATAAAPTSTRRRPATGMKSARHSQPVRKGPRSALTRAQQEGLAAAAQFIRGCIYLVVGAFIILCEHSCAWHCVQMFMRANGMCVRA